MFSEANVVDFVLDYFVNWVGKGGASCVVDLEHEWVML